MTDSNKSKIYHEQQYPAQRLRYFISRVTQIKEDSGEDFEKEILLLKNANIDAVDLINQAVKRVEK